MRTNLIMHFHCADCGGVLELAYDSELAIETETYSPIKGHDAEPTGAAVRYLRTHIRPCRHCIEKHTGPAKQLAAAIQALVP